MLVVGIGNPDRGDDAAGSAVAARVGGVALHGSPISLIDLWDGHDDVVVVDAMVSGAPVGTVRWFNPGNGPLPRFASTSTHDLGLADVIELARSLGRLPSRLQVAGIEIGQTAIGAGLSGPVAAAVDALAAALARLTGPAWSRPDG